MRRTTTILFLILLLAGLWAGVAEPKPPPAPLDQEEYLDAEDWFQAGLTLNGAKNYREAAEAFGRSIAIDPENALAWLNLGTAQALLGEDDAAIHALKQSVRLDPKLFMGFANLGEVYLKTGHYQEALDSFGALLALQPDDPNAHFKRGLAYLLLYDAGKAQAEYLSLKILDPELADKLLEAINQAALHR